MASVYTTNNGIELIGTGEKSGVWGTLTNQNFEIIDAALDGQISIELANAGSSGSPNTVNISEGLGVSDGNNRMFIFTDGASFSGEAYVKLTPIDAEKIVYIRNNFSSSSPHSIVIFQGNYDVANSYTLPRGKTAVIYFDGEGLGAVASNMFDNAHFDALNIVGNAAVGGNLTVTGDVVTGDDLSLQSDGAILNFGADDDVSLTHVADTAIRLNSDKALQFRDAGISIASSTDGKLDIDADNEVEITTTTLDINATTVDISATNFNVPPNSITLGTDTVGDYVAAVGVGDGLTRTGAANGEGHAPILSLATNYGDTKNPYGDKAINRVLASPATQPAIGAPSTPTFRSLVAADIPSLSGNKVDGGNPKIDGVTETFMTLSNNITSGLTQGVSASNNKLFLLSGTIAGNFGIDILNFNLGVGEATNLTFVLQNGSGTTYIPSVFKLGGTPQTIKWQGGSAPTGLTGNNPVNIYSFTVFRTATSTYIVLGNHVSFDS